MREQWENASDRFGSVPAAESITMQLAGDGRIAVGRMWQERANCRFPKFVCGRSEIIDCLLTA